ncbi:MAG: rod-binding protein [Spirochaetes bacterium]|jgi:flagellar protein FlgJ|nr:rod-binding protein [Spirochaetota bacterium]MCX7039257.1 rod-binding protein [Spirochaetota bacterium]
MQVNGAASAYSSPLNPSPVRKPVDKASDLYKACLDFESLFIKQMLDVMRKSVKKEGLLDGGTSEEIFTDMLYDEYAKKMAETAQFGLARTIYDQVSSKL